VGAYICVGVCGCGRAPALAFSLMGCQVVALRGLWCGGGMGVKADLKLCEQFQRLSGLRICNVDMVAPNWPSWGANTAPWGADGMASKE
jgi:hypothetical protein